MNREPIFAALFALVSGAGGFVTYSRVLQHWNSVVPEAQPALFQAQKDGVYVQKFTGLPPKRTLQAKLYLYAYSTDPTIAPSTLLNPLLDAVEAALLPPPGRNQTLGGLVTHAWIEGRIETDEGTLGPQAVAIIPVNILVP